VYALEGICLVLPCERSMRNKSDSKKVVTASLVTYGLVTLTYASLALSSGIVTDSCDIIVECLDDGNSGESGHNIANTVRLALSAALCLSHPIQLYPSIEILEAVLARVMDEKSGIDEGGGGGGGGGGNSVEVDGELGGGMATLSPSNSSTAALAASGLTPLSTPAPWGTGEESKRLIPAELSPMVEKRRWTRFVPGPNAFVRLFCCAVTLVLGTCISSFGNFSNFVGAVGLTFVGFVLPVLLFLSAKSQCDKHDPAAKVDLTWQTIMVLVLVMLLGVFNICVTGSTSFMKLTGITK
jgi:amino acid permease